jgi:NAD(P)-dependent dehydrogenase (short-subunit alcohol dehydrogenase family)
MKSVLITGCSSGFGLDTAIELAGKGWQVIATMRNLDRRGRLDEAAKAAGVTVEVRELDVRSAPSIESALRETLELTGGRLDAVVHNAGIGDAGYFEDLSEETVRKVMETNFFGVLALTRLVLPIMRKQRSGRIVVVSSSGAFIANPSMSAYAASKWAVEGWAESLACEVAPFGIDVCLVEPGMYNTDIWHNTQVHTTPDSPYRRFVDVAEPKIRALNERYGRDPREVGQRISAILAARHPQLRNPVGPDAWAFRGISHVLPFSVRRILLNRLTGANRVKI